MRSLFQLFDSFLCKVARRQDDELRQAVKYGYDHFQGKELEQFLRIVDDVDEKRSGFVGSKKDEKRC